MNRNNNNDDIFKYILYGIVFITLICIAVNSSTRKVIYALYDTNKLKKDIEKVKIENETFKKRLDNLSTKPKELEKLVKLNFGFLAENEVEYIFEDPTEKEEKKSEL